MKQRRLLPRFGLRSILVLTTVVAAVCGLWIVQAQRQRDAAIQLEPIGVRLEMEDPAEWCRWLPEAVLSYDGGHYFCPVTHAALNAAEVNLEHPPLVPLLAKLPSLKSLRIDRGSLGSESLAGLSGCRRLETLDLSSGDFDDECLSELPRMLRLKSLDLSYNPKCSKPKLQFPQLKELRMAFTKANDETLSQIAKLTQLQDLTLDATRVSDIGVGYLKNLKKLEHLSLDSTSTTGAKVSDLRSLESLLLSNTPLEDRHFSEICDMPNLEQLDVRNCRNITDVSLSRLGNSKTLRRLDITDCRRISQASLETIAQISNLGSLRLYGTGITSLGRLQRLSKLEYLTHSSDQLDIEGLLGFSNLQSFINYDPRNSRTGWKTNDNIDLVSAEMIADMAGQGTTIDGYSEIVLEGFVGLRANHFLNFCPRVEYLSLARSQFASEVLWVINSWPSLERLCLNGSSLSNEDLSAIREITSLLTLQLDRTEIDDEGLTGLVGLEGLRELSLTDTRVTQTSMPLISSFKNLRKLELPFVPTTESLLKLLDDCPWLEEVYCCKAEVVGSDRQVDSEKESDFYVLKELAINLGRTRLSLPQFEQLLSKRSFSFLKSSAMTDEHCEALVVTKPIDLLDLDGSPITDAGMRTLSRNAELRSLDLTNTQVSSEGIRFLSKLPNHLKYLKFGKAENVDVFIEALQGLKLLADLHYPVSELSREDAAKFLTCCYEREMKHQLKLSDSDFSFGRVNDIPIGWMLGKSGFDSDASHFNLLGPLIDNEKLREFEPSENLEFASAANVVCDPDLLIDNLTRCPNLLALTLHRVPLSIESLAKLKKLKRLYRLKLTECGIEDSHLSKLAELTQVVDLILDSNQIQGEQLGCFNDSKQLDLLSLRKNPLSENGRRSVRQLEKQSQWLEAVR